MAITEKLGQIVDFLTRGLEPSDEEGNPFDELTEEVNDNAVYGTKDNLALAPVMQPAYKTRNERQNDLKVVSHPNYKGYEVVILEPRSFGEAGQIVQNLQDKKTIVLNLHLLDKEQSQRTIDFVCGAAHALGGSPQKVGDMVFVFTPSNVTLSIDNNGTDNKFQDTIWGRTL